VCRQQPARARGHAQGAGGAEGPGQLQLFVSQGSGGGEFPDCQRGQGGVGTPGQIARADCPGLGGGVTGRPKIVECLLEAVLSELQATLAVAHNGRCA
jgi:hypothetical protein